MNTQYKDFLRSRLLQLTLVVSIFGVGCIPKSKVVVTLKKNKITEPLNISVSHVQVINHQIIITGKNLDTVKSFQIKEGGTDTSLQIESKNNTSIVANSISNVTFAAGRIFDFILSSASGASTFTVDFSLCDSTLGGKGFNCLMAPTDKQVLSYDIGTGKWRPRSVNGLAYQGTWSALTALPATGVLIPGDYYIVSVANAPYNVGDWIVLNNDGVTFEQIENSTAITSVFARTGNIVGTENDYDLDQMGDVDLTTSLPIIGDALVYNGVKWVPGAVSGSGGGTVTAVSGTLPISVVTGSSTPVVSISQATTTTNGYLSSADWNIFNNKQAALPAGGTTLQYLRGDKTFVTLNTTVVPEGTNLYFTNARALGLVLTGFDNTLTGQVAATDSMLQAFGRVQNQINSLTSGGSNYLIKNGPDTLSGAISLTNVITATGAGDVVVNSVPLTMTSAVNKTYADGKLDKTTGGVVAGVVTLDNDLKVKGGTNYVTIKGHATSANYNFVLPSSAGTAGYVLSTDGSGNTSWIIAAGGGAPTGTAGGDLSGTYPNPTITALDAAKIGGGAVSNTEYSYLDGVTSSIQTQLNAKLSAETDPLVTAFAKAALPTCTAGQVLKGDGTSLTCVADNAGAGAYTGGNNFVVVTNGSGALSDSTITTTKLGYLSGVTSDVQTQLNAKQDTISKTTTQDVSKVRIYGANATNYVELTAATLTGNRSLIFPDSDGVSGHVLSTNGAGVLSWIAIPSAPVTTVFGRNGVVVATAGDYTAAQITNTPAGNIAATTAQAAIDELDTEKQSIVSLASDIRSTTLTGLSTATNSVIAAADSVLVAFGKLQAQMTAQSTASSNYLVKNGTDTISGTVTLTNVLTASGAGDIVVPSVPLTMTSAVNKTYADGKLDKTVGGTVAGVVTLDDDLKIKSGSNYVTIRGNAATAADYNFVLPANAGTAGYFLSTDGSGNTSWASSGMPENSQAVYRARVATTANVTLSGTQTIDGVSLVAGDRVLVKNQSNDEENGVYVVAAGAWSRAVDLNTWSELIGYQVNISEGNSWDGMNFVSGAIASGVLETTGFGWSPIGNTLYTENTSNGYEALVSNTSGYQNIATGHYALVSNTTGYRNAASGYGTMMANTTGSRNTASGYQALRNNTTGADNTATGSNSLRSNVNGVYNTANGNEALYSNTSGSDNAAIGVYSLNANTIGNENVAVGNSSLTLNTIGNYNTAVGTTALRSNSGKNYSTAIGYSSMYYAHNTATNLDAYNTALGAFSLRGSSTASSNSGIQNTAIGASALRAVTTGSSNIGLGYNSGSAITSGSNNVVIGSNTGSTIATSSNNILLSDGAGTERARFNSSGYFGINQTVPGSELDVKGTLRLSGSTSGYVGFAPAAAAGSTIYTLPASDGSAGQLLKTNGAGVLSWVTDSTGGGAFSGTASRAVATDGAGALTTLATTSTELDYVSGVTSSIQTQLNAKEAMITAGTTAQYIRGDKTLATFSDDVRGSVLTGLSSTAGNIAATDTLLQAFGKMLNTQTDYVSKSGNTTVTGSFNITGIAAFLNIPTPTGVTLTEAANVDYVKTYVGANGQWMKGVGGNAADIYFNTGNVGIGTSSPTFALSVGDGAAKDGSIMAKGYGSVGTDGLALTEAGAGIRMFWYPKKAAFRAGEVWDVKWDDANIGNHSAAFGVDTLASGNTSFAAGEMSTASNDGTIAMGWNSTASGVNATALGEGATSSGMASVAIGTSAIASAERAFAIGETVTASGENSLAMGKNTTAASLNQSTFGRYNLPLGTESALTWVLTDPLFVVGNGTGSGASRKNAMMILKNGNVGFGTATPNYLALSGSTALTISGDGSSSTAAGVLEVVNPIANGSIAAFDKVGAISFALPNNSGGAATKKMGEIIIQTEGSGGANGYGSKMFFKTRADNSVVGATARMVIDPNGSVGIGTTSPGAALHVVGDIQFSGVLTDVSDRRLKKNLLPLESGLETIRKIKPYSYVMKDDPEQRTEYGVIAQDLLKINPNLVRTVDEKKDLLGVNYLGLIPYAINAIQDVDIETKRLRVENERLKLKLKNVEEIQRVQAEKFEKLLKRMGIKSNEI